MESKAYNARKLYAKVAEQIRMAIETGALRPGDKLPPLAELAEKFGCSRATIREALGSLRGQGLVEFRQGNGTFVRTASLEMWMDPLEAAILLSRGEMGQLLQMLIAVLAGIASAAADNVAAMGAQAENEDSTMAMMHASPGIDGLAHALYAVDCAQPNGEEVISAEMGFYMALAVASGNALFENGLRVLQEALRSSLRLQSTSSQYSKQVCRDLYEAVQSGDATKAREVLYAYGSVLQTDFRQYGVANAIRDPKPAQGKPAKTQRQTPEITQLQLPL